MKLKTIKMEFGKDDQVKSVVKSSRAAQRNSRKLYQIKREKGNLTAKSNISQRSVLKFGLSKASSPTSKFRISTKKFKSSKKGKNGFSHALY